MLAATPNQPSSGLRRACSTSTIDNESMALMQCPSVLSAPTLMGHFYTLKAILQPPHTTEEVRCGAGGHPKSTTHQDRDELVAPPPSIMRAWL